MAKKPQRLSQSLGRLRALEQDTAVVASPVDTFTRQAAVTESTRAREIERGLSQLSPVIAGILRKKANNSVKRDSKRALPATGMPHQKSAKLT